MMVQQIDEPIAEDDEFHIFLSIVEPSKNAIPVAINGDFVGFASLEVDGSPMVQQIDKPIAEEDEFEAFSYFERILAGWPAEQEAMVSGLLSLKEAGAKSTSRCVNINTNALTGGIDLDETCTMSFEI